MGRRNTVPNSRYGIEISVMEHMSWSYEDLLSTPAPIYDEIVAKIIGKNKAEKRLQEVNNG